MADIELPALGESVTEGTITRWFKAIGDEVAEDEPLFEVSTDKVDSEVPSPVAGFLTEILVEEGDTVDVGTRVAVLSDSPDGGGATAAPEAAPEHEPLPEPLPGSAEVPRPEVLPQSSGGPDHEPLPEPLPVSPEPEPAPAPVADSTPPPAPSGAPALLSPVVRRLLDEAGVDASTVTGTGIGGRITRADAEEHIRRQGGASPAAAAPAAPRAPAAPAAAPSAPAAPVVPAPLPTRAAAPTGVDATVPLNKIRKITAEHMVRSLGVSAHVYVSTEVDYESIDRVRTAHKAAFKAEEGVSLTYLPFVARALVDALADFPHVNASMGEESELVVHGSVNLGIAVDLDHEGLIVPVVHEAQDRRLRALARDVADLAGRAKNRRLAADDITGGTVTITNVGSTGSAFLLPIINQPQVMILSTDGIKRRPVVVSDSSGAESIAIHSVGNLTLGWDHRAFDGAYAAQFLAKIKEILETRDWETEL
jgi:2-oxoglutarate dehydrogenase E2 component (dihydrolipoamide succinyltransferase)